MGGHAQGKAICLQGHIGIISCQIDGAALFCSAGINPPLSINMARNKSGAFLLTIQRLTIEARPARQRMLYHKGKASSPGFKLAILRTCAS
jgi:hypothetical protein